VLILGGDICPDFIRTRYSSRVVNDNGEQRQRHWLDTEFRSWLNNVPAEHVVAIWGNHDFVGERDYLVPKDLRWTLLNDSSTVIDGVKFYGTPWVPGLPYWAFFADERRLKLRAEAVEDDTDILISHGPPHLFGDYIPTSFVQQTKYGNYGGEHVGDSTLNSALMRVKPALVVCGHIHEAYGRYDSHVSGATIFNVALNDAAYNPVNPIVELPLGD
jgi:Icc-related predicted phosphoesterase